MLSFLCLSEATTSTIAPYCKHKHSCADWVLRRWLLHQESTWIKCCNLLCQHHKFSGHMSHCTASICKLWRPPTKTPLHILLWPYMVLTLIPKRQLPCLPLSKTLSCWKVSWMTSSSHSSPWYYWSLFALFGWTYEVCLTFTNIWEKALDTCQQFPNLMCISAEDLCLNVIFYTNQITQVSTQVFSAIFSEVFQLHESWEKNPWSFHH